jgi:D-serine deaminase-like pyridoxal phosphate-dependent protein
MSLPFTIQRPTILVDEQRARRNIERMAAKARASGVRFRPHFKTHKSGDVGEWFREADVQACCVSSVDMAEYFSHHGWRDITIAFPVNILEADRIGALSRRVHLGVLVETADAVQALAARLTGRVSVWIDIDTGYGREGIPAADAAAVVAVARAVAGAPNLELAGLLTHAGHSYHEPTHAAIAAVYDDTALKMNSLRQRLDQDGFKGVQVSVGDTPTCSVMDRFSGVNEVRPGGFVFYDLRQLGIGSCAEEDIAVAVALPVVSKHPERRELIVYGGAAALSRDYLDREDGTPTYGSVAEWAERGWGRIIPNAFVSDLSQEHGIITADDAFIQRTQVGDVLAIVPVHACLLAYQIRRYVTLDGDVLEVGGML